jgi:hypothetical protein
MMLPFRRLALHYIGKTMCCCLILLAYQEIVISIDRDQYAVSI